MAASPAPSIALPVRSIPGSYGMPMLGPLKDRLDYFWFQGPETFFRQRMQRHKSTVFRTNMPPTFPFFLNVDPRVVALLDTSSFSALFDTTLVDKSNVLVGDYMPSVGFTGNRRVCAYLDPSEPAHSSIKSFAMDILKQSSRDWASQISASLSVMWDSIDKQLASSSGSSSVSFVVPLQKFLFSFLCKAIIGADPSTRPDLDSTGFALIDAWLALQLLPTVKVGVIPQPLEELLFHSFAYPSFLASPAYRKIYRFVEEEGGEVVRRGEKEYHLTKEEAIHNLIFILGFNAFGGFSIFLPKLISAIGTDKTGLQSRLRSEVREKGRPGLSFETVAQMELVNSTVYEVLRLNPPVPLQYGRARKDFVLRSHEAAFEIRAGELLCGYQVLAMRDPRAFDDPEKFLPDRFTDEKGGRKLLERLFWSNGPQTGTPGVANKQCPGKDYVVATASMIVAWILTRYDEFTCDESNAITKAVKAAAAPASEA